MSNRGFKRLFGESHIERKFMVMMGIFVLIVVGGSLYGYARQAEGLAYDQTANAGRLLIAPILAREHLETSRRVSIDEFQASLQRENQDQLAGYKYQLLVPETDKAEYKPNSKELELMGRMRADPTLNEESARLPSGEGFHYFGAVRATESCVQCHNQINSSRRKDPLSTGELMAVIKVTLPTNTIEEGRHTNRALLLTFGLVASILILVGMYLAVRMIVVKPIKHLKAVSDSITAGQYNVRSDINTRDEFEDLSVAFNQMVHKLTEERAANERLLADLQERADELANANLKLYESSRLKSEFVSTVSHELRTPLNGIIGFSDVLLKSSPGLTEKQARWAAHIRDDGRRLVNIINDILDLAKIESGRIETKITDVSVEEFVRDLLPPFMLQAENNKIELRYEPAPQLPRMQQDVGKLRQVLTNLLSNAIKFTPQGGRVTLQVSKSNQDMIWNVIDTGIGISEKDQQHIFEKFRQVNGHLTRDYEGTGLGLSIVRELCRLLGGEVTLKSSPGAGSTFTVRIPFVFPQTSGKSGMFEVVNPAKKSTT